MKRKIERKGKQRIPVIANGIYSNLIYQIASGNNYAQKISEAIKNKKGEEKPTSIIVRQLDILRKEKFVSSEYKEDKSVFPMQRITIYSVNWKKIIEEFVKYIRENIDYVCSENERLGMNLDKIIKGFNERIAQARDNNFENSLKDNKLLYAFFEQYYSTLGKLKESWTIVSTFDFLTFFGDLNFLYAFGGSHDFYNVERLINDINSKENITFPDWLKKEKKPETEAEQFERYKKIHNHTTQEFDNIEKKNKEQLKEVINRNKEVIDLFILSKILEVIKIKPSLQLGLNEAVRETGKKVFLQTFSKEQMKEYLALRSQYHTFSSLQEEEQIKQDLKEILGENILKEIEEVKQKEQIAETKRTTEINEKLSKLEKATPEEAEKILKDLEKLDIIRKVTIRKSSLKVAKPTENKANKFGNTNQNIVLSSETKQGESPK